MSISKEESFYLYVYKEAFERLNGADLEGALKLLRDEVRRNANDKRFNFALKANRANKILDEIKNGYESLGYKVIDLKFETKKNFIVGTRQGPLFLVYEVGISWDPILDLPYIPASSLKGALRSYMLDLCEKVDNRKECVEDVISLFGVPIRDYEIVKLVFPESKSAEVSDEGSEGLVIFSDAYPISFKETPLTPDIINPHYYKGGKVVENEFDVSPTPITFLTVSPGVTFRLIIALIKEGEKYVSQLSKMIFNTESYSLVPFLTLAFAMGIGAKTSRGYGELDLADLELKGVSESKGRRAARITWGEKK